MPKKLSLKNLELKNKKVLLRVDFNVPQDEKGNITDNTRIQASLPTIKYILEKGGSVILLSHLGRPKGSSDPKYSLSPCAAELSKLLNRPVAMAPDCIGPEVEKLASDLNPGQLLLLENLRFHTAEEKPEKDPSFAKKLASLGDCYVDDAFGTAHRAHSSTASLPKLFPGKAAAGFLMEKEIKFLSSVLDNPKKPFIALIGGAKISTKIAVLKKLLDKVDALLIGGGMAFTFFKAQGLNIGNSICEDEFLDEAKKILNDAKAKNIKILLPNEIVAVEKIDEKAKIHLIDPVNGIPQNLEGVDIGPKTIDLFSSEIALANTILWNGPMGVFEVASFANGTIEIAKAVADSKAVSIVGGGETISALKLAGVEQAISHISTGGGATLEFIENGTLPGIEALTEVQ